MALVSTVTDRFPFPRDGKNVNLLVIRLNTWNRYYEFVVFAKAKYEEINPEFIAFMRKEMERIKALPSGSRTLTQEDQEARELTKLYSNQLAFYIESFHVFASILLDRIADTICFYFKLGDKMTHDKLGKRLDHDPKMVKVPGIESLVKDARVLQKKVVAYRNRKITHLDNPRYMFGTSWVGDQSFVSAGIMEPKGDDSFPSTESIPEMFALIDTYAAQAFTLLADNVDKSILV